MMYLLKRRKPVKIEGNLPRNLWLQRRIRGHNVKGYFVSTVFLVCDHAFLGEGEPILFETMIIAPNGDFLHYQTRCATHREALAMHQSAKEYVKTKLIN